jgi:adenylate cyclase
MKEIERKFLIEGISSVEIESHCGKPDCILQSYLVAEKDFEVRIRIENWNAFITIKSGAGLEREEREVSINRNAAAEIIQSLMDNNSIIKYRYKYNGWEIDVFADNNIGLTLAEIELSTTDTPFTIPSWLSKFVVRDVTEDSSYKNKSLVFNRKKRSHET